MSKTIAYETANGPQQVDAAHPLPVNATVSATAAALATAAAPTLVEGSTNPFSSDLSGGLRITGTINATSATTNTAAAPSYVEGSSNAFSANLTGDLRTIAKQSGTWTVGLSAGSNLVGKVGIDQTTPGTTNLVAASNFPVTLDVNSGNKSANTIRVVLATDQPALSTAMPVSLASVPSHAVTNAGTFATQAACTEADGANVTLGAKADAKSTATDTTAVTIMSVLKQVSASVQLMVFGAGTAAAAQRTTLASDDPAVATLGAISGAKVITDANGTIQQYLRGLVSQWIAGTLVIGTGTNTIGNVGHGKTIKTVSGTLTADTDVIAAVTSKRIKVIAYSIFTTGTNANAMIFKSNGTGGTELWRLILQSQASAIFGANLAIPAPSFLFATVAGEKLTLDVGNGDTIHYSIAYFDDDAT